MISRPLVVSIFFAVALVLAAPPVPSFADPLATPYYKVTYKPTASNAPPLSEFAFSPEPPNLILNGTNPLLNAIGTDYDASNLKGFIGTGELQGQQSAGPVQVVGVKFSPSGLPAGGSLVFNLPLSDPNNPPQLRLIDYDKAHFDQVLNPQPQLEFVPNPPGFQLQLVTQPTETTPTPTPTPPPVSDPNPPAIPEPLSLVVWSALACLGVVRCETVRRAKRAAA